MATQIKLRRDTYQNWYDANPTLALGEPAYDTTNNKLKIGNGTTAWRLLTYLADETGSGSSDRLVNGLKEVVLDSDGNITLPNGMTIDSYGTLGLNAFVSIGGDNTQISIDNDGAPPGFSVTTNALMLGPTGTAHTWRFGPDGDLSFPNGKIKAPISSNISIETEVSKSDPPTTIVISGADFAAVNLTYTKDGANSIWYPAGYNPSNDPYIEFAGGGYGIRVPGFNQALYVNTGSLNEPLAQWDTNPPLGSVAPTGVYTYPNTYTRNWTFETDGSLAYPNVALQRDTATVACPGNASTVVYTASGQYQHTIRLLIQVEGSAPGQPYDTQACEMIIAKSFRANALAATVYGIVHTSVAPLATFTAQWNATSNRVEVLCATTAIAVNVRIFATEISTSD